jgi:Flp pilus assembly protein TadG
VRRLLNRWRHGTSRGQALVETGLILSLILLLSMATFDLGRAISSRIALNEATQEGALYAGYRYGEPTIALAQIQARVQQSSSNEAVMNAVVTMPTPTCTTSPGPGIVRVRSTYAQPIITPIASAIFGGSISIEVEIDAVNVKRSCS